MNLKRKIKDAGYKSQYSVAINVNGKNLSIREEGGQTKIFRSLADGGDIYLYARQNSDGTFDLEYIDHSKYMQSRSANDNVEESLGTYGLVDVLNTMADFKGPVDDYFFARESSVADSRRVSDAGHLYSKVGNTIYTNSKDTYRGVKGSTFISHGEWSDPEVIYEGREYNYYDLEDYLYNEYKYFCEENGEPETDEGYDVYADENAVEALNDLWEYAKDI